MTNVPITNQASKGKFSFFVDFDGTISQEDVGEHMFLEFGDPVEAQKIVELWIKEEINSTQSWQRLCKTIKNLDFKKFDKFIDSMQIDSTFHDFVNFAESHGNPVRILSDGLDYYINRILKREGLERIEAYSNILITDKTGQLIPSFPHSDEECDRCANCKRNQILNSTSDEQFTVYIGDGYSDTCPAQFCDYIFAKNSLLKYCEKNRISYYPFESFTDVIKIMKQLGEKKRLKKRHQAILKRKEIFKKG